MLVPYDLASDNPELFSELAKNRQPARAVSAQNSSAKWSRSGPGPVALIGNTWVCGVTLAPVHLAPGSSVVSAVTYRWDASKLRLWAPQTRVRLLLTDAISLATWMADVTDATQGSLILPAGTKISGNCQAIFQMTAGAVRGRLYKPPFIETHEITVRYRY